MPSISQLLAFCGWLTQQTAFEKSLSMMNFFICCVCASCTPTKAAMASPCFGLVLVLVNLVTTNLMDPLCDLKTVAAMLPSFLTAISNVIEKISFEEGGIHLGVVSTFFHV